MEVTQFIRPNGRQKILNVEVSNENKAQKCIEKGARFTVEELSGMGVLTCVEFNDENIIIEFSKSGDQENALSALEKAIDKAYEKLCK